MITRRRRTVIVPLPVLPALLLASSLSVHAATPPDHPSPSDAYRMMNPGAPALTAEPAHVGQVVSAIDANEYTYIEVSDGNRTRWIVGPKTVVSRGDTVRFDDGVVMTEFHSKLLRRTFPAVMFVSSVVVTPAAN